MKKFLEVLMDDNGELHMSTDCVFADSIENPPEDLAAYEKEMDQLHRKAIRGVVNAVWKEKKLDVSKAIRYLSMAEIITCAEPYEGAEELWYAMMFDYLPYYERYSDRLKIPYGYNPVKNRPIRLDLQKGIDGFRGPNPFKMN